MTPPPPIDLRALGLGPRLAGGAFALAGVLVAVARLRWWPELPRVVPFALVVTGLGLIGVGMVRGWRFHLARWRARR